MTDKPTYYVVLECECDDRYRSDANGWGKADLELVLKELRGWVEQENPKELKLTMKRNDD